MAFSPDGQRIVTGSFDNTAKVWDAQKNQGIFILKHTSWVRRVAFSPDGQRVFAWDDQNRVLAWSTTDYKAVDPTVPPARPEGTTARSPDGFVHVEARGSSVVVIDSRRITPEANHWPLPDRAERLRHHGEQARLAEQQKQWFAAAFHLDRLLRDQPDDADLTRRRDDALKNHAAAARAVNEPGKLEPVR